MDDLRLMILRLWLELIIYGIRVPTARALSKLKRLTASQNLHLIFFKIIFAMGRGPKVPRCN